MLNQALGAYGQGAQGATELADWGQQQMQGYQAPTFTTQVPQSTSYNMGDRQANLDQVINAANAPVMRQLQEQILPQLRSSALESGAYSSDRAMGVVPGQAIDAATRNMQDVAAKIGYEDYNNWETRRLEAFNADRQAGLDAYGLDTQRGLGQGQLDQGFLSQIPGLMEAINSSRTGAGDVYQGMMGLQQGVDQQAIDNALAQEQYDIYRPFAGLDQATQLLSQLSGNYGTTTGQSNSTQTQSTGGLGAVAQGIMGAGLGAAGLFTGAGGAAGPLSGIFKGLAGKAAAPAINFGSMRDPTAGWF